MDGSSQITVCKGPYRLHCRLSDHAARAQQLRTTDGHGFVPGKQLRAWIRQPERAAWSFLGRTSERRAQTNV